MVDCGNSLEVHFAGTRTTVPKFLQACLDQALSDHPFAVGELQGMMTPAGKVGFVTPFVAVGLLSIVRI